MNNNNILFIRSMFSEEFLSKYGKESFETMIIDSLTHGVSPYMLIEQLTERLREVSSELVDIKANGIPPIQLIFKN